MTNPPSFQIGQEVEIIGLDHLGGNFAFGDKIKITMKWNHVDGVLYSNDDLPWYPASSLRLVEPAELKIGDWVEVIRPGIDATGKIMKVIRAESPSDDKYNIQLDDKSWWRPTSLRKLTPEEIQQHEKSLFTVTANIDCSKFVAGIEKTQDMLWKMKIEEQIAKIKMRLDNGGKLVNDLSHQVDAFESRLKEDRNLMTEIEERLDERQDDLEGAIKTMGQTIGKQQNRMDDHWKCINNLIDRSMVREEMPDCKPNDAKIRISITRGGIEAFAYFDCPIDGMKWSKKVLDGMRSGKS